MKKLFLKILKSLIIGALAVVLVAIGLNAADYAGNFSESVIGRLLFGADKGPCPPDMVYIPKEGGGFCLDKYEVSPSGDCPAREVSNQNDTKLNLEKNNCQPVSVAGAVPWVYLSQPQAVAACAKAGKRLPIDAEWYLASLNTPDKTEGWTPDDCQVDNNWSRQPGLTGSGKNCFSSFGAYDMIGNVWEWVYGEIVDGNFGDIKLPDAGYIKSINIDGLPIATAELGDSNFNNDYFWIKNKGVRGMARGGYYDNQSEAGFYAVYLDSPPEYAGAGIGFRCAK